MTLSEEIIAEARALGFADIGFGRPATAPAGERLRAWVGEGRHGDMGWMAERIHWRADPAALWPEARSVIMLADSYEIGRASCRGREGRRVVGVTVSARER